MVKQSLQHARARLYRTLTAGAVVLTLLTIATVINEMWARHVEREYVQRLREQRTKPVLLATPQTERIQVRAGDPYCVKWRMVKDKACGGVGRMHLMQTAGPVNWFWTDIFRIPARKINADVQFCYTTTWGWSLNREGGVDAENVPPGEYVQMVELNYNCVDENGSYTPTPQVIQGAQVRINGARSE